MSSNSTEDTPTIELKSITNGNHPAQENEQSRSNGNADAENDQEDLLGSSNSDVVPNLEDILGPLQKESGIFKLWGGPWQFLHFLTAITAMATDAVNLYIFVFANYPVKHQCAVGNSTYKFDESIGNCSMSQESINNKSVTDPCTEWNFDSSEYSSTITTEFNLVCSQSWLSPAFQLCYIVGTMVGDLVGGTMSDRLGRRKSLRFGVLASAFCVLMIGISPWLSLILFCRVIQGVAYSVMFCPSNTLMTEGLLPGPRSFAGPLLDIFYASATMILAGLAYLIRDWRILHFITSFFVLGLIPLAFFAVDESIRWLIQENRLDEAQVVLKRAAKLNGKADVYKQQEGQIQRKLQEIQRSLKRDTEAGEESFGAWLKDGFKQLYSNPVMRLITFVAPFVMFLMGVLHNGIPFNANNFPGSSYWYIFGMGLMELCSVISGVPVTKYFSRVRMAQWTLGLSSICVLGTILMPEYLSYLNWGLIMVAMWSVAMTYNMEFMWIDEIFPTSVRQRGGSLCHFIAHGGAFAAGFITEVLASYVWWLPLALMSGCGLLAMCLASILPETKGLDMCNTVEDVVRRRDDSRDSNKTRKVENNRA